MSVRRAQAGLPSHITVSQAARMVGVSQPVVWERVRSGALAHVVVEGVKMVRTRDCVRWRERRTQQRRGKR